MALPLLGLCVTSFVFLLDAPLRAAEQGQLLEINIDKLPRVTEEPESLKEFFEERTRLAVGLDQVFESNIFLRDNAAEEDYITYLEGQVAFIDPRGTVLYGLTHEVNIFRYNIQDLNAIDHDFRAFFDLDPGGRYRFRSDYALVTANSLLLGPAEIDTLRRDSDFKRRVEHVWDAQLRYALNDTNEVVPQVDYSLFDDQGVSDADSDRKRLRAIVDLDHDLRPNWILFGGYEFTNVIIPGNELKSSESHAARLGMKYELTDVTDLNAVVKWEHRQWKSEQQGNNLSFDGAWIYQLGPRTELTLQYVDEQIPSFSANRLQFRSTRPSLRALYTLTPLIELKVGTAYEKQRSGGEDVLTGGPTTHTRSNRYGLQIGLDRQVRDKGHLTLDYAFSRSKSGDYTNHQWVIGFETEL